jgi:hypothetical protein
VLTIALLLLQAAPAADGPPVPPVPTLRPSVVALSSHRNFATYTAPGRSTADTGQSHAIEHSNGYYTRLTIHRYASYATVPLFVTEYFLGQSLFNNPDQTGSTKSAHGIVAGGIAVLFGVNTVTGVWNLWDSRHDPDGKTRRYLHSFLMLAADGGFAWAGATAPGERGADTPELAAQRRKHKTIALTSMGVSLVSYGMMLLWKD